MGFTSFFMVYGAEVVLPNDLQYGFPRVSTYQPDMVEEALKDAIDLLEEARNTAIIRSTGYQQALRWYHVRKVHPWAFRVGDLVLR
jgi:hypothetical protein